MGDDFDDVEDMLEAPFRKGAEGNGDFSPVSGGEGKKRRSKHHHHSRHSPPSGSRSPPRRRHRRSESRDRRQSRERRRRSGSRDRHRVSRSGERHRRSESRERRGRNRMSRSGERQRRSESKERSRRVSRERNQMSGSRDRRQRSGSRDGHRRSSSKERHPHSRSPLRRQSFRGGETSGGDPIGMYRRVGGRSPDPEPPSEEKDRRTVMCMQLAAYVGPKELEEFFQKVGQVKEVKMIADKNSRRSKGIAYVEFHDENSIPAALQQSGQKLFGVPIIVQPTMAEKNRLAAQAQNLMKKEGPRNLYVGSLHYNITEPMLKKIFEPFGFVEKLIIQRDENGLSKGYGFIEFRDSEAAERAKSNLDGFELAGRPIKINHVTHQGDHVGGAMELLDSENFAAGVGMTQQGRANLMAKLAEGHNAGLIVPTIPALAQVPTPVPSSCFMLTNMFDPSNEVQSGWQDDICDDVLEVCMAFGNVLHIHVDVKSQGHVYVKCANPQVATSAMNSLNGRFFDGKKVTAQIVPDASYHMKFSDAAAAVVPLKPSS